MIAIDTDALAESIALHLASKAPKRILLRPDEAAEALGISRSKLDELRGNDIIRAVKPVGLTEWRYRPEDLQEWAERSTR